MIVSLSGWKRSGKDKVASILVKTYGFRRVAFADLLKNMVARDYGLPRESLDDPKLKESPLLNYPVSPKDAFTDLLAGFMRNELRDKDGNRPVPQYTDYLGNKHPNPQLYHTPRSLAILMGSTMRFVAPDYWVTKALSDVKPGEKIVITDMRYRSEMEQIAQFGEKTDQKTIFVRIDRFDTSPSYDPSERDLDTACFDFTLSNRGSVEDLEGNIAELAKKYKF